MPKYHVHLMTPKQRRALSVALILVLLLAIYFLRSYFFVVAIGVIIAYLFNPIFKWLLAKTGRSGLSITLTFIFSVISILVPIGLVLFFTVDQTMQFANEMANNAAQGSSLGNFVDRVILGINNLIDKLPGDSVDHISTTQIFNWLQSHASNIAEYGLNFFTSLTGSIINFLAQAVIYVYIFISVLRNQDKLLYTIRRINPLGERATNLYLKRIGAMTTAMVKGQFIIAGVQGLVSALMLWLVGVDYFFLWFVLLTFISIIPLGSGVLIYPIGVIMLITGHIWQGIFLIAGHAVIVTNLDNIIRPKLAPKKARLDSALVILSIFAGIAMFGFVGIVLGPVLMIMIVTTIQVYLAAVDHDAEVALKQANKPTDS